MQTVRKTSGGLDYLLGVLRQTTRTITRVAFWRIPHNDPEREDISLKVGRYTRIGGRETPETEEPRSELTLDDEEFRNLITFLEDNYEPFRARERRYIPVPDQLRAQDIEQLRGIFENSDTKEVVDLVIENRLLPEEVVGALQFRARQQALAAFREMLADDLVEHDWQRWFKTNDWIFGSDFVRVLDEREIDTHNVTDYLMEAYDGFLDIIEIKRPGGGLRFWAEHRDHGNLVPATDLVKAITQVTNYLYEVEREANSVKFLNRVGVRVVKPRATLIFGRSSTWGDDEHEAYRMLNRSYHALTILTFDHVLERAERILASKDSVLEPQSVSEDWETDFPF